MLVILLACTPATNTPPASSGDTVEREQLRWHMSEHFQKGTSARDLAVKGDVAAASVPLSWLGAHLEPEALGTAGRPFLDALTKEARVAAVAPSPEELGVGMGKVADACGSCHHAFAVKLSPVVAKAPVDADGQHAERATWAVGALWTGVLANADSAWAAGAGGLGDVATWSGGDGAAAVKARDTLRTQVTAAPAAKDRATRAASLGQVIGACGGCHAEAGK